MTTSADLTGVMFFLCGPYVFYGIIGSMGVVGVSVERGVSIGRGSKGLRSDLIRVVVEIRSPHP